MKTPCKILVLLLTLSLLLGLLAGCGGTAPAAESVPASSAE